jgi:hypothetical protein
MRFISEAKPVPHSLHKKKGFNMLLLYIIVVVLALLTGCLLGRELGREEGPKQENKASTKDETRVQISEKAEEKALMETENAFSVLLGYNADIAYGLKK